MSTLYIKTETCHGILLRKNLRDCEVSVDIISHVILKQALICFLTETNV